MDRVQFNETSIQRLFGHEAAEDEDPARLREYYFKSNIYDQVITELPVRVLVGHKGIGKSALFQIAVAEHAERDDITVVIKPDDVLELISRSDDFLQLVRDWKLGLRRLIVQRAGAQLDLGESIHLPEMCRPSVVQNLRTAVETYGVRNLRAKRFFRLPRVFVFIDDLDRGWQGKGPDVQRISALLSAIRDLASEDRGLFFRVSLRSDVYFLVRTSDESTDKIEGSVVWHTWSNHEIFELLTKRVETYFGRELRIDPLQRRSSASLAHYLDPVFEDKFRGRGHWANAPTHRVLMSLIRKRPRDLVKLCSLAARDAQIHGRRKILTENLLNIFEEYSQGRIQDTVNEFRSELPDVERLVLNMRPTVKEKTAKLGYTYETADLLKKIKSISEQGEFRFRSGAIATPKELAVFLYKINFLTARHESDTGIIHRRYFEEQRYLQSQLVDFGFAWEVHPAYRWALQPQDLDSIYATLQLSAD